MENIEELMQKECDERMHLEEHFQLWETEDSCLQEIDVCEDFWWYRAQDVKDKQKILPYLYDVVDFYAEFCFLCPNFINSKEFVEYFEPIQYLI